MTQKSDEWTLEELAARVALVLAQSHVTQHNKRVTEAPSSRTIRLYFTQGIIDPPLRLEGRTALYGIRHLRQLVAIKRLQARGHHLEQIREIVPRMEDVGLRRLADLQLEEETSLERPPGAPDDSITGIRLDHQVLLLLENPHRPLRDEDRTTIRVAAGPLLKLLKARQLLP